MTAVEERPVASVLAVADQQLWSFARIDDVIATSAGVSAEYLNHAPFTERGEIDGAVRDRGAGSGTRLERLNAELTA